MSDSRTAGGLDRLPWLSDEPSRTMKSVAPRQRSWLPWAAGSVLAVATVSFWLGARSDSVDRQTQAARPSHSTTIALPAPSVPQREVHLAPQPQVAPSPQAQFHQTPTPQVRIAAPRPVRTVVIREIVKQVVVQPAPERTRARKTATARPSQPVARPAQLRAWPPRVIAGAYGRLVQIGAYGSRIQAKHGWVKMVRAYPAVAHLPAIVVETRNSRGRPFYRFQIGTTSQAHSEVLCQRMQGIQLSCAVVGLPWKAKVER